MRKAIKNLPVFFMWLAWVFLTAHQVIPHDHHLADSFSNKENECPVSNSKTNHHNGFPLHCHVFNDLTSEKVVKFVLANYIHFTIFSAGSPSYAFKPQALCIRFTDFSLTLPDSHLLNFSFLRAPPLL